MRIEVYYSEDEMSAILSDIGYTIARIETWDPDREYLPPNGMENKQYGTVAYKGSKPEPAEYQLLRSSHGIDTVFRREFKERLTNKLF